MNRTAWILTEAVRALTAVVPRRARKFRFDFNFHVSFVKYSVVTKISIVIFVLIEICLQLRRREHSQLETRNDVSKLIIVRWKLTYFGNLFFTNYLLQRFQRTIITDQQREMLFFVYSREQRPSTRLIDQLSSRLGLSSRTVTNWFHNYRTRSRPKLKENAGGSSENGASPVVVQTPRKPLEIGDPTTKSWYKVSEFLEHVNTTY